MDRVKRARPITWLAVLVAVVMAAFFAGAIIDWITNHESASLGLVTVGATLALALGALLTIRQNDSLIKAAIDEANASAEQAKASAKQAEASNATLAEMQTQRQLAYRPWLVYAGRRVVSGERWSSYEYVVKNVGTGPAVNVVLAGVLVQKRGNADDETREHVYLSNSIAGLAAGDEEASYNHMGAETRRTPDTAASRTT